MTVEVTFKDFREVAEKKNWTRDFLTSEFRGKIDDPGEFFDRVLACQAYNPKSGRREDRSEVVIPYRSILTFYFEAIRSDRAVIGPKDRLCPCGCGSVIVGKKKFASSGCKQRAYRNRTK